MRKINLAQAAQEVAGKDSVRFNAYRKYNNQTAWPFWLNFIPFPAKSIAQDLINNGLGEFGLLVPPNTIRDLPIALERDTSYRQLAVKYSPYWQRPGTELTGTITIVAGNPAVVGIGTAFLTETPVGTPIIWVDSAYNYGVGIVAAVTNNTNLTLESAPAVSSTGSVAFFRVLNSWYDTPPNRQVNPYANLTGTISIAAGTANLVGVGTLFLAEINVGDVIRAIDASGADHFFQAATITNNTTATVTETVTAAGAVTGQNFQLVANVMPSGGTLQVVPAAHAVLGTLTTFTTDFTRGDTLFYPDATGIIKQLILDTIISDTLMKFTGTATAGPVGITGAVMVKSGNASPVPINLNHYRPITQFIRVGLFCPSLRGRFQYGGLEYIAQSGLQERRHLISNLQGIDSGMGMLRVDSVQPPQGDVILRFENFWTEPVIMTGSVFGYKIALDLKEEAYS